MKPTTVAVPVDGSEFAEWALPVALSVGKGLNGRMEIVSIFDEEPVTGGWPLTSEDAKAGVEHYQHQLLNRVRDQDVSLEISHRVLGGPIGKTLDSYLERAGPDLVVMSTHGRGPLSRAWLGSIADRVVRHARMPVLLIRPAGDGEVRFDADWRCRNVVVALDGSDAAEKSLEWASRIGGPCQASYTLVRVVPSPTMTSVYLPDAVKEIHKVLDTGRDEAERYLAVAERRLQDDGLTIASKVVLGVQPAVGITRTAEETNADLIAIATHGRGGVSRAVLGSVADKVVRSATTPVLLTRIHD